MLRINAFLSTSFVAHWSLLHASIQEVLGSSPRRPYFCLLFTFFAHHTASRLGLARFCCCCCLAHRALYIYLPLACVARAAPDSARLDFFLFYFPLNFQCMHIYSKCHHFKMLITKCACIQIKHVIYVKCSEFYLLS